MTINVLMLSSESCVPCKIVKPTMIEVCDKLGLQLSIQTISGPTDPLVLKYAVRAVPTVLLRDGDAVLKSFTGAKTKDQIEEFLK